MAKELLRSEAAKKEDEAKDASEEETPDAALMACLGLFFACGLPGLVGFSVGPWGSGYCLTWSSLKGWGIQEEWVTQQRPNLEAWKFVTGKLAFLQGSERSFKEF